MFLDRWIDRYRSLHPSLPLLAQGISSTSARTPAQVQYQWSTTLWPVHLPPAPISTYWPAKLLHMNLKGEALAPSSASTGLVVILYPRQTDLTADNSGYQSSLQPLGEIYGLWHQCLSKSHGTPLIKATWTLIQWSMSKDKINKRFLQPSEDWF